MKDFVQKYLTTEALFSISGAVWFVVSSIFPVIPATMPVPTIIPGLDAITPGLLVAISLVPIVLKIAVPGKMPFIGTGKTVEISVPEAPVTAAVQEQKDV